jgi:hypothetical protein
MLALGVLFGAAPMPAFGQTPDADAQAIRTEIQQLRERLDALEARLAAIEGATPPEAAAPPTTAAVPAGAAGAGGETGSLPVYGSVTALSKIFNPDIAVIGNFLGAAGSSAGDAGPSFDLNEVETSFQAIVDPYARADFFFAISGEGVDVEEGYVSFPALPGGLLAKAGKFRSAIGRVNGLHAHNLPWIDRPLVIEQLLGGEEGLAASGVSAARLVPNPWIFLEATGEVSSVGTDLAYVARARGYRDVSESSNLDFGVSFADGPVRIIGADAVVRYRPLRSAMRQRFLARTEAVWRRDDAIGLTAFGAFAAADYQLARRWFAGGRFDYSRRAADPRVGDRGVSWLVTFWPSEFSQVRAQYRRTTFAEGHAGNDLLIQLLFSIGAHGAHVF